MILFLFSRLFSQFSSIYLTEPPRKINKLEGFRSKKSMASQDNWSKAQTLQWHSFKKIANITMILGIFVFLLEIISFIFWKQGIMWLILFEGIILGVAFGFNKYYIDSKLD